MQIADLAIHAKIAGATQLILKIKLIERKEFTSFLSIFIQEGDKTMIKRLIYLLVIINIIILSKSLMAQSWAKLYEAKGFNPLGKIIPGHDDTYIGVG